MKKVCENGPIQSSTVLSSDLLVDCVVFGVVDGLALGVVLGLALFFIDSVVDSRALEK